MGDKSPKQQKRADAQKKTKTDTKAQKRKDAAPVSAASASKPRK